MSFLSRYWKAVEREHNDTGMNHGDIVIDLDQLLEEKDTPATNTVQHTESSINPQPTPRPIQDGIMSRGTEDIQRKFDASARGSARPYEPIQGLATRPEAERQIPLYERHEDKRHWGESSGNYSTEKTSDETYTGVTERLSSLGVERSYVRLDKVVINGNGFK